jgi:hypothetical protein
VFEAPVQRNRPAVRLVVSADKLNHGEPLYWQAAMTGELEGVTNALAEALRSSVGGDGGWSYVPGKASRLEPTCWAALALLDGGAAAADAALVDAALNRIAQWQRPGGLLCDIPVAPPNLAFNGLASIVIHRALATHRAGALRLGELARTLLSEIATTEGARQRQSENQRQDNQLVGWPWNDGTFSWVEPTSWCLLALKTAKAPLFPAGASGRITEAELVLRDRCCIAGGWNAGNSNMLGRELLPYVPTTAIALLALQNQRQLPEVVRSLAWLESNWTREVSAMASSLALMAMRLHNRQADVLEGAVCDHITQGGGPRNLASSALTLYALTGPRHEYAALAL